MEKFKSPKLLITDHYDEEIRKVDVYIEELLETYKGTDLLQDVIVQNNLIVESEHKENQNSFSDEFIDQYQSEYNYDQNKLFSLDIKPGTTRIKDYLELVRSKAIDELKKAEQHNLDNYKLNKELYKYDLKTLTDEKVEEMRQNLFKDKFAFVVKIDESDKSLLKFHTILTDFYLDEKDIEILK